MTQAFGLASDILLLLALGAAIYYCARLSRQFSSMQADRKAFEALIAALGTATTRADASIRAFRETAEGDGDVLSEKIARAQALSDELEIMIQAGDSLADRLQALAERRPPAAPEKEELAAKKPAAPAEEAAAPRSRAERELLEALKEKRKS